MVTHRIDFWMLIFNVTFCYSPVFRWERIRKSSQGLKNNGANSMQAEADTQSTLPRRHIQFHKQDRVTGVGQGHKVRLIQKYFFTI